MTILLFIIILKRLNISSFFLYANTNCSNISRPKFIQLRTNSLLRYHVLWKVVSHSHARLHYTVRCAPRDWSKIQGMFYACPKNHLLIIALQQGAAFGERSGTASPFCRRCSPVSKMDNYHKPEAKVVQELKDIANRLRIHSITSTQTAKSG